MSQKVAVGHSVASGPGAGGGSSGYSTDPHDLDDIIERLHIGTLKREKLRVMLHTLLMMKHGHVLVMNSEAMGL